MKVENDIYFGDDFDRHTQLRVWASDMGENGAIVISITEIDAETELMKKKQIICFDIETVDELIFELMKLKIELKNKS
jgi:hypothetical protein